MPCPPSNVPEVARQKSASLRRRLRDAQAIVTLNVCRRSVRVGESSARVECGVGHDGPELNRRGGIWRGPKAHGVSGRASGGEHEAVVGGWCDGRERRREQDAENRMAAAGTVLRGSAVLVSIG